MCEARSAKAGLGKRGAALLMSPDKWQAKGPSFIAGSGELVPQ